MTEERMAQILSAMPPWTVRLVAKSIAVSVSLLALAAGIGQEEANEMMAYLFNQRVGGHDPLTNRENEV